MRRLSFILVLTILVGGLALGNAQAAASRQTAPSSILLAQAAVQPPSGFLSGIVSAIDKMVSSVIDAVKATFGFRPSAPKVGNAATAPAPVPSSTFPTVARPAEIAPLLASLPAPAQGKVPTSTSAPVAAANGSDAPESGHSMVGMAPEAGANEAKTSFSLFPGTTPKLGAVPPPSVAKQPAAPRSAGPAVAKAPAATATAAASTAAVADSAAAKLAHTRDPLKYAEVNVAPTVAPAAKAADSVAAPAREVAPPVAVSSAPATRAEAPVASPPLFYSQPIVTALAPARTPPTEVPVSRPSTPVAAAPVSRAPVVAVPRFIDTVLPTRPVVTEPASRVAVAEAPTTIVTRDAALPTRTPVDVATLSPMDLPPENLATVGRDAVVETPVAAAPVAERPRMIILNDGAQQVIIQSMAASTTIIDPVTTEAVVCKSTGDFPILSLGEDEAGITRGVVLSGGTILLKPTDFFKKVLRLEGAPFAIDTPAKDCTLITYHSRLSTPDLMVTMPKLSEADREWVSAKAVVVEGGRVFIVAADNTAEKTVRGIVVREASGRVLLKMLPERNQVAQAVRGMTVTGDLTGRMVADLVLTASDGTTTTQHCEFSKDIDMTCTARGAL